MTKIHLDIQRLCCHRSVKESGEAAGKRFAFCPSILRKIRYVDPASPDDSSNHAGTSKTSKHKHNHHHSVQLSSSIQQQPASSSSETTVQVQQPQSFSSRQPSLPRSKCHLLHSRLQSQQAKQSLSSPLAVVTISQDNVKNNAGLSSSSSTAASPANFTCKTTSTTTNNRCSCTVTAAGTSMPHSSTGIAVRQDISNHGASSSLHSQDTTVNNNSSLQTLSGNSSTATSSTLIGNPCPSPNCLKLLNNSSHLSNTVTAHSGTSVVSQGLIDSRAVTSYRDLRISFFTDESPTHSQPPSITIKMKPDDQGRFGFNVKVSVVVSFLLFFLTYHERYSCPRSGNALHSLVTSSCMRYYRTPLRPQSNH